MKIALVTPEVYPLSKTGGLADYSNSITLALSSRGIDIEVLTPWYGGKEEGEELDVCNEKFYISSRSIDGLKLKLFYSKNFFASTQMYGHANDTERFAFFSRAASKVIARSDYDAVHCNDWQTGYIPLMLKQDGLKGSLFVIHNIQFQGLSSPELLDAVGIDRSHFQMEGVEYYGKASSLKAGIVYSDKLVTVSPTYSREIQTEEYGYGMEGIIRKHAGKLKGILNGLDYDLWNPASDRMIDCKYSASNITGKQRCRSSLLREFSLPQISAPLISFVGRIDRQKGVDIIPDALSKVRGRFMFIILGTGDREISLKLQAMAQTNPYLRVVLRYDETLAHRIYAGSDAFLMPSRFEPCGYGQLIAMRYGTVQVVHKVGGLADTVEQFDGIRGTGIVFNEMSAEALAEAIERTIVLYADKTRWRRAMENCMRSDFSWNKSSDEYIEIYREIASKTPEKL